MHIPDDLYKDLLDYLAKRPWCEVNLLITKLVMARANKQAPIPADKEQ